MPCTGQRCQNVGLKSPCLCLAVATACDYHLLIIFHRTNIQVREPHMQRTSKNLQLSGVPLLSLKQLSNAGRSQMRLNCLCQVFLRHALSVQVPLQEASACELWVTLVASQGKDLLRANSTEFCKRSADTATICNCNNDCIDTVVSRGKRMRYERRYEVTVTCGHLPTMGVPMLVFVIKINRSDEKSCLHHEVSVVELYIWISWTATLH
mmetsp:Transcript_79354/g.157209  ORF Transcript_79354/g.157209 Transcript_79354/m.157209 type:complete len:209 (+) Transcript_79354:378-1004(+)